MNGSLIKKINWKKLEGLVPAIIQDTRNGQVLMLGYMDEAALKLSINTGKATFFSRTRKKLWVKGETSGNFLLIQDISLDCDQDSLLIIAKPAGPVCHTGTESCFSTAAKQQWAVMNDVEQTVRSRIEQADPSSYSYRLSEKGINKVAQKVGEEGVEVVIAALSESDESLLNEAADLLFHLLVLLLKRELSFSHVLSVLAARQKD